MKKRFFAAAMFAAMLTTSCSNEIDNGGVDSPNGSRMTTIVVKTSELTKSTGTASSTGQSAFFEVTADVTLKAYSDAAMTNLVETKTLKFKESNIGTGNKPDPDTHEKYTLEAELLATAKYVSVELNSDNGTTLTSDANTRQGNTNEAVVLIDAKSAGVTNNGQIIIGADGSGSATLTLAPEMARLEMINNMIDDMSALNVTNTIVDADGATVGTMTAAQVLAHYGNLRITNFYLDNKKMKRGDASILDYNVEHTAGVWREQWLAEFAAAAASSNFTDVAVDGAITSNANPAVVAGDLADLLGTGNNMVGYNVFPTNAPSTIDEAKATEHPHFIIQIKYNPSTGFKDGANGDFSPAGYGAEITRYINLAAYSTNGGVDGLVHFSPRKLYQFNLSDALATLVTLNDDQDPEGPIDPVTPPTVDPDDKNINVTVNVQVLDWAVEKVIPLPL